MTLDSIKANRNFKFFVDYDSQYNNDENYPAFKLEAVKNSWQSGHYFFMLACSQIKNITCFELVNNMPAKFYDFQQKALGLNL